MAKMLLRVFIITVLLTFFYACSTKHKIEVAPVETSHSVVVEPIHITIDINVKIDKELDDFFGDIDDVEEDLEDSGAE